MDTESHPNFVQTKQLKGAHAQPITAIAISRDGRLFASGGRDRRLRIYKTASSRPIWEFGVGSAVRAIVWHPDSTLITYATEGCVTTLRISSATADPVTYQRTMQNYIHSLCVRPDGQLLAIGHGGKVSLVRAHGLNAQEYATVPPPSPIHGRTDATTAAIFRPESRTELLVSYIYGRICQQGVQLLRQFNQAATIVGPMNVSPSGKNLSLVNLAGEARWINSSTLQGPVQLPVHRLPTPTKYTMDVAFISDDVVAVASENDGAYILHRQRREAVQQLPHSGLPVQIMAHWGDTQRGEHLLITGSAEPNKPGTLTLWRSKQTRSMPRNTGYFAAAAAIAITGIYAVLSSPPHLRSDFERISRGVVDQVDAWRSGTHPGASAPSSFQVHGGADRASLTVIITTTETAFPAPVDETPSAADRVPVTTTPTIAQVAKTGAALPGSAAQDGDAPLQSNEVASVVAAGEGRVETVHDEALTTTSRGAWMGWK
ncbi:WD40-repeat-containing domain protein [Roridomyces roridus]|uniref:WD40-repeat-containing domain protein n=1 Tax=Roridomyces roridus TaxID=1738132 RepID=A0AAD7C3K1_9AGAR|nr:WD40-repeat-containing domain protein [Roridomyces roridus]